MADFIPFIGSHSWFQVLEILYRSQRPLGLREIHARSSLSLGGVQDVLRRLLELGLVSKEERKNRSSYRLALDDADAQLLGLLLDRHQQQRAVARAKDNSLRARKRLDWITHTLEHLPNATT